MISTFANRLRKNLAHWHKWARRRGTSCFRIYDRDVPQFPFAIDWFETVAPRAATHLHVQEIDTGWKRNDEDYNAWLVAVCDTICVVCAVPAAQLHLKRRDDVQRLLDEGVKADLGERWNAVIKASVALAATPIAFGPENIAELRRAGLDDAEIVDVINGASFFNWANRLMLSLGEPSK